MHASWLRSLQGVAWRGIALRLDRGGETRHLSCDLALCSGLKTDAVREDIVAHGHRLFPGYLLAKIVGAGAFARLVAAIHRCNVLDEMRRQPDLRETRLK